MNEEKKLAEFAEFLENDIQDRSLGDAEGADFKEEAFVGLVTDNLAEIGMIDNPVVCFHRGGAGNSAFRLNGYAVTDDEERLDVVIADYNGTQQLRKVPSEEITRTANMAVRAIAAAARGVHEKMERASDQYSMMRRIAEVLQKGVDDVRVLVITNGITPIKRAKPSVIDGRSVKFEVYDLKRLMRTMSSGQSREVIEVDLEQMGLAPIPCVAMPPNGSDYEAYLAIFPGEILFRIYEEYGPRLLEYNVRAFLQATGKVNKGIRETLRTEAKYFMAYNNGISVTVDELTTVYNPGKGLQITHMKGLQIVNGGQTTASIHRARKKDRFNLAGVHVQAKLTKLPSDRVEDMVRKISRFANTQNVIQEADLSANEPFHVELERLSRVVWTPGAQSRWFYERARGQYRTAMNEQGDTSARLRHFKERTPPSQKFTKTDLAKYLNAWDRLPHVVSGGAQKNFVMFMRRLREIRGASWKPDEVYYQETIAKAILFRSVASIVRLEDFPAYKANIVAYLVAYLSHRSAGQLNFDLIWKRQGISRELTALIRAWSHEVAGTIQESAGGRNVTEWCKKEGCWEAVRARDLSVQELPAEIESISKGSEGRQELLSPEEQFFAAECMKLSAEQWFAIHKWGRQDGNLAEWQAGIALTLSGYASGGWQRVPSAKQARQAVRILDVIRQQGFMPEAADSSVRED